MYKILKKRRLSSNMTWLVIEAPLVARKAKPWPVHNTEDR